MTKSLRLLTCASALAGAVIFASTATSVVYAHPTTTSCWETWNSSFATTNMYDKGATGTFGWSKLNTSGQVVQCTPSPTIPAVTSSCWSWRRRCGEHYIRIEAPAHIHGWFDNIPVSGAVFCTKNGLTGFAPPGTVSPNCPDWANEPRQDFQPHDFATNITLWVEHRTSHVQHLYDLEFVRVGGRVPMRLSVKDENGTWWTTVLDPNGIGPNGEELYHDVTNFGWEITEARMRNNNNSGPPVTVSGLYFSTAP